MIDPSPVPARSQPLVLVTLAVLVAAWGCGPGTAESTTLSGGDELTTLADGSSTAAGSSSAAEGSTSTGAVSTAGTSATSAAATSTGEPVTDVGLPTTGDGGPACNGKIDVLFIISDGPINRESLEVSIPEFAATMQDELAEFDLHVMVADPDGKWGDSYNCPKNKCPADGACPAEGFEDFPCWALHEEGALTKCDNTRGAGVVFRAGPFTENKPCGVPPGQRFITGDDPNFAEVFACLAHNGANGGGSLEHGATLGRALAFDLQGGCNAGFLREDALLLVVQVVAANWDETWPWEWADYALEAKDFEQDMVVALAIARDWKGYEPEPLCEGAEFQIKREGFAEWVQYLDHGIHRSLCAPTFAPFFSEAASMAAELCSTAPG